MGAFYYTFMRFCLNKADFLKKKEQIINLKKKNKKKNSLLRIALATLPYRENNFFELNTDCTF